MSTQLPPIAEITVIEPLLPIVRIIWNDEEFEVIGEPVVTIRDDAPTEYTYTLRRATP